MIDIDSQNLKKVPDTWKSAGATAGNFDNQCPKVKKNILIINIFTIILVSWA